ncbi:MAG: hypothetical protein Q4B18_00750 [Bacillota bacterium]|nr:hypothetical protein [Bacillota bacterium]
MGNGIIGKVLYFWVFILGAMFILKFTGYADDNKTLVIVLIAIALIYVVWNVARAKGKKKQAEKAAAYKQPVKKGTAHKKKKR